MSEDFPRFTLSGLVALLIIGIILFVLVWQPTTDTESSEYKALQAHGFDNIVFTGINLFSCGRDEVAGRSFVATNPRGKVVKGTVCCGMWFKGCTVRF